MIDMRKIWIVITRIKIQIGTMIQNIKITKKAVKIEESKTSITKNMRLRKRMFSLIILHQNQLSLL
jgi:hypothetical protein